MQSISRPQKLQLDRHIPVVIPHKTPKQVEDEFNPTSIKSAQTPAFTIHNQLLQFSIPSLEDYEVAAITVG
jgi:hypothetical protein